METTVGAVVVARDSSQQTVYCSYPLDYEAPRLRFPWRDSHRMAGATEPPPPPRDVCEPRDEESAGNEPETKRQKGSGKKTKKEEEKRRRGEEEKRRRGGLTMKIEERRGLIPTSTLWFRAAAVRQ
ncbi:hypothetical protein EYF80_059364 [Liparis tanakae]|uniref:Uncharacterized protein n=1 Tax=Liparis tanakae TaxID=230148 RepID=A0A4Z2EQ47_9TELE|nr:hypothetical protein EYF80_059364 [Liparis tanakae]